MHEGGRRVRAVAIIAVKYEGRFTRESKALPRSAICRTAGETGADHGKAAGNTPAWPGRSQRLPGRRPWASASTWGGGTAGMQSSWCVHSPPHETLPVDGTQANQHARAASATARQQGLFHAQTAPPHAHPAQQSRIPGPPRTPAQARACLERRHGAGGQRHFGDEPRQEVQVGAGGGGGPAHAAARGGRWGRDVWGFGGGDCCDSSCPHTIPDCRGPSWSGGTNRHARLAGACRWLSFRFSPAVTYYLRKPSTPARIPCTVPTANTLKRQHCRGYGEESSRVAWDARRAWRKA